MPRLSHAQMKKNIEAAIIDAENGDVKTMRTLAYMYEKGEFFPKDIFAAEAWYRMAAEYGDVYSMRRLGVLLNHGNGVAQDHDEALVINRELMIDFDPDGTAGVGEAYKYGWGVEKDEEKASHYLDIAFNMCMEYDEEIILAYNKKQR